MLKSIAVIAMLSATMAQANASSGDAWDDFARDVEEACIAATQDMLTEPSALVDPFGSASYGLAIVTGNTQAGRASVICVFDKQARTVEIGGELDLIDQAADNGDSSEAPASSVLDPLTADDLDQANLEGELACTFSQGDAPPLLYALGTVASDQPAQAIAKVSGTLLSVETPGGFDAMLDGASFSGSEASIDIAVTGQTDETGESPASTATLVADFGNGQGAALDGLWRCGP